MGGSGDDAEHDAGNNDKSFNRAIKPLCDRMHTFIFIFPKKNSTKRNKHPKTYVHI